MSVGVNSGFLSYSQDATIAGSGTIQWDGSDLSSTLDPTGLGGIDLTAGATQDAILIGVAFDDLPVDVTLDVYTDAGNASSATITLPGLIFSATNFAIPYSVFTPLLGAGADFADVGAITLTFGSSVTAPDLVIDYVTTTALVTPCLGVALLNDVNSNSEADPGDTLRYTLTVSNPDDAFDAPATGVEFAHPAVANAALVVGSVTATQGTVTAGNSGGDTTVGVDIGTIADGASVTITFDVVIDDPLLGVTQIDAQGDLSTDALTLRTDDCTAPGFAGPTTIAVNSTPSADLSITKTLTTPGPWIADQAIAYTITVANAGPDAATLIQVTDTPTNLIITSVSGGGCAALPCSIASLASLASVDITVTATIDAAGAFDNAASVTAAELDTAPGNNTDASGNGGEAAPASVEVVPTLGETALFALAALLALAGAFTIRAGH